MPLLIQSISFTGEGGGQHLLYKKWLSKDRELEVCKCLLAEECQNLRP